ncbi:MAG: hypothetical protein H6R07_2071 [Proteobacteria bacterium]|nr:hypothetical protein [Pseudomonadota bacterium]
MKAKTLLAATMFAMFGFGTSAQAGYVDLFDDPAGSGINIVTDNTVDATSVFQEYPGGIVPSTSIIGGYRDIIANLTASNGVGTPAATAEVGGGGYSFSTSSGDTGIGTIQWDGQDGSATLDTTGLGGLNLITQAGCPATGCNSFQATVLEADLGFEYQIGVYTDAGNFSILTANTQFAVTVPTLADYQFAWFLLADGDYFLDGLNFNIQNTGTVDFTNIGALEFVVNSDGGTAAVDLALDSITKVPEPGSLALLGIGLLGTVLMGRRRAAIKV